MKQLFLLSFLTVALFSNAQYVQPERNDTVYMYPTTPFDSVATRNALAEGTATIKGVAFTRPTNQGFGLKTGKKILANKIVVTLYPLTPYFEEYLSLRKKVNYKKLKFAYISNACYRLRLTAITNSSGEFTFPKMKPGKYYICGELPWYESGTYNKYSGTGYDNYGSINYYTPTAYRNDHTEYLEKLVEVKQDGETVNVKLK